MGSLRDLRLEALEFDCEDKTRLAEVEAEALGEGPSAADVKAFAVEGLELLKRLGRGGLTTEEVSALSSLTASMASAFCSDLRHREAIRGEK